MKYHIVILGCQMNKSDSERVQTALEHMGYSYTDNEAEANLLGVVACSVRQKAIDKVYSKIKNWNQRKNTENILTFVTGCILPADKEKFLKLFDIVFQLTELSMLPDIIGTYGVVTPTSLHAYKNTSFVDNNLQEFWHIGPRYTSPFEAFVPIQNGCDKFCTFCAVPYTRGREISRDSAEIINEIKGLVDKGYKSITLLGQNVNSYGLDKKGTELSFPALLDRIGAMGDESGKEFRVYFTSPHPCDMQVELLQVVSRFRCLAKQIHIPLQSGDNEVLKRMNRKHTVEEYDKTIGQIREIIPTATIFTDIIVGFAGETDEQFENTRKAMERYKFNMAYIARYSPRPGAVSARWEDDVPYVVKSARLAQLSGELRKHTAEYNASFVGKTMRVLVTGHDRKREYLSGVTEGLIVTRFRSDKHILIGSFVDIRITSSAELSIEGVLTE